MTDPLVELSSAGQQRKESILAMAKAEARHRKRRRRTAQALVAVIVFALLVPTMLLRLGQHQTPSVAVVPKLHSHADQRIAQTSSKSRIIVMTIETDPGIIERLAIPPQPPRWKKIGDDELLRDLASAHQPAGLAYVGDHKPLLLFRSRNPSSGG